MRTPEKQEKKSEQFDHGPFHPKSNMSMHVEKTPREIEAESLEGPTLRLEA